MTFVTTESTSFRHAWERKLRAWPTFLPWRQRQFFLRNVSACLATFHSRKARRHPLLFLIIFFAWHPNYFLRLIPILLLFLLTISLFLSLSRFLSLSLPFCLFLSSNYKLLSRTQVSRYSRHSNLPRVFLALPCQNHNLSFDFIIPCNMRYTRAVRPCLMLPRYLKERCFDPSNVISFASLSCW